MKNFLPTLFIGLLITQTCLSFSSAINPIDNYRLQTSEYRNVSNVKKRNKISYKAMTLSFFALATVGGCFTAYFMQSHKTLTGSMNKPQRLDSSYDTRALNTSSARTILFPTTGIPSQPSPSSSTHDDDDDEFFDAPEHPEPSAPPEEEYFSNNSNYQYYYPMNGQSAHANWNDKQNGCTQFNMPQPPPYSPTYVTQPPYSPTYVSHPPYSPTYVPHSPYPEPPPPYTP